MPKIYFSKYRKRPKGGDGVSSSRFAVVTARTLDEALRGVQQINAKKRIEASEKRAATIARKKATITLPKLKFLGDY